MRSWWAANTGCSRPSGRLDPLKAGPRRLKACPQYTSFPRLGRLRQAPVEVAPGRCVIRLALDRLFGRLDSLVPMARRQVGRSHIVVGLRIARPEVQGLLGRPQAVCVISLITKLRGQVYQFLGFHTRRKLRRLGLLLALGELGHVAARHIFAEGHFYGVVLKLGGCLPVSLSAVDLSQQVAGGEGKPVLPYGGFQERL